MGELQRREVEFTKQKKTDFNACSAPRGSTFSGSLSLINPMKTSLLAFITALAVVAFVASCTKKEETTTAASTGTTTTHATAKKTTTAKTTKPPPSTPQPSPKKAAKKKAAAEESASPSVSPSGTPQPQ